MLSRRELESAAELKHLTVQNAEKAYFQDLVLFSLYGLVGRELVFKGGTCLYKMHQLNRFSEDLDFSMSRDFDVDRVVKKSVFRLGQFGSDARLKYCEKYENEINYGLLFKGPLYDGRKESMCFLSLNISRRQKCELEPKRQLFVSDFGDIPARDVFLMDVKEMLAEKVAAVHFREKARDVYDVWFLLCKKRAEFDEGLINKKLKSGRIKFSASTFFAALEKKKKSWKTDLSPLIIGSLPEFQDVLYEIKEKLSAPA